MRNRKSPGRRRSPAPWLDDTEFIRLWRWLECPDTPVHPPDLRAVQILLLTGQRVEEIARLHKDRWDSTERVFD